MPSCRRSSTWRVPSAPARSGVHSGVTAGGEKDPTGCWLSDEDAASARATVEAAGLVCVDQPYIADVARALGRS